MMLLLAAAAAAAAPAPPAPRRSPVAAMVQARATVRIIAGARVSFDRRGGLAMRDSVIRSAGVAEAARLVEFQ